jgi:hypothetical protein
VTTRRASLSAQIAEVRREIDQRQRVYARLVSAHKMREGEAALLIANMEAVLETLTWLQRNEAVVRAAVAAATSAGVAEGSRP